jgi:hypothetical protein
MNNETARSMKLPLVIIGLFLLVPSFGQTQATERLFCASCGERNSIAALFCGSCGGKLDKHAIVSRLQLRLAQAERDSLPVTMMPDEIKALAQAEATRQLRSMARKPLNKPVHPQTELDRILNVVAPVTIGVGAFYLATVIATTAFK